MAALWYKSLIRPNLEYCASLLYSNPKYITKELLKIENRCLKIIYCNSPKLLTRKLHNIPNIEDRLKYLYLLTFFKLINNKVPIIDQSMLPSKTHSVTRLSKNQGVLVGKSKCRFSIVLFGATLYNSLPPNITNTNDFKKFKSATRQHLLKIV